uniref:Reverse transcriptase domain-containing protein n=1 Tax=Fagus sylvatica TaxID=28930 RepID=A0A2N9FV45_FAGSY
MRILGWNCRGICNASTVRALKAQIRGWHPSVLFLCETKASVVWMNVVAKLIGFQNLVVLGPKGRVGGICMLWSNKVDIEVLEFNCPIIAIRIKDCAVSWSLVGFYGPPQKTKRDKTWVDLHALLESIPGPWMCCNRFTWSKRRWGRNSIRERLDRGIANIDWRLAFPRAVVYHLGALNLDHCPLLIDTNPKEAFFPRPFRFEAVWAKDPRCYDVKILELTTNLEKVQSGSHSDTNTNLENSIQVELNGWLARLETVWRQKSRETWLKEGDRNSRFFHLSTIIRRKHNSIDAIKYDFGDWIISKSEIKKFVVSKFIDLFTEEPISFPSGLDNLILPTISSMQNEALCNIPTPLEIKNVIFGMYNLKALGPDGLPALFYKQYWPIMGESVISAMQNFFRSSHMLNECVSSVSFSILINGGKTNSFKHSRGLKQRDPLSPYLFILCQDVLSRLIDRQFNSGAINGVKMNPFGPAFTHVMYADDLMLFAKATSREVLVLDDCLELYCQWSGQLVNRDKSGINFSKLVSRERKRAITEELNMKTISDHANYLGAPLFASRNSSKDFKFLQEKVESRLKGWRCKSLSWAG